MTLATFVRAALAAPVIPSRRAPLAADVGSSPASVTLVPAATALAVLLVAALAGAAGSAHAAELYRWSEPDGSLTYSPTAPDDGTPYDVVDPMTMQPLDAAAAPATGGIRRSAARSDVAPPAPVIRASGPAITSTAPASSSAPSISKSPNPDGALVTGALSPSLGAAAVVSGDAPKEPGYPASGTTRTASGTTAASNEKARRCGELEKRVISLERRLSAPLTPQAMDDTVVQMARYQRSVERHCR